MLMDSNLSALANVCPKLSFYASAGADGGCAGLHLHEEEARMAVVDELAAEGQRLKLGD